MKIIDIEVASNGYIVNELGEKEVFISLHNLFNNLLFRLTGRCETFTGDAYGRVVIYDEIGNVTKE